MITIAAKVSCDESGCKEKTDITVALAMKTISVDGGNYDVPKLEIITIPYGWEVIFAPSRYGGSMHYGDGIMCSCPKHKEW